MYIVHICRRTTRICFGGVCPFKIYLFLLKLTLYITDYGRHMYIVLHAYVRGTIPLLQRQVYVEHATSIQNDYTTDTIYFEHQRAHTNILALMLYEGFPSADHVECNNNSNALQHKHSIRTQTRRITNPPAKRSSPRVVPWEQYTGDWNLR